MDAPQTLFLIDNVVFGEQATLVVGGSDTGKIHIFDKNEGSIKQVLQHADRGRVQTVTTYNSTHHSLIFGATSTNDSEPTISIWCRKFQLAIAMAIMAYVSVIKWDAKHTLTYRNPVDWTNIGDHIAGKCLNSTLRHRGVKNLREREAQE
ncbi:hypothetical protein DFH29DRAFT_883001 [Suillus ampliporus]|nr:hypothetical protein DFH29DRAFT_883001 [Suillus ampliporus]